MREGEEEVGRGVEMETERGGLRRVQPHHMRHHVTELTNQIAHLGARQIAAGNNSRINTYFDVTTIIIIMFCTDMKSVRLIVQFGVVLGFNRDGIFQNSMRRILKNSITINP